MIILNIILNNIYVFNCLPNIDLMLENDSEEDGNHNLAFVVDIKLDDSKQYTYLDSWKGIGSITKNVNNDPLCMEYVKIKS